MKRQIRHKLDQYFVNTYTLSEGGSIPEYLKTFEEIRSVVPPEYHDSIRIDIYNSSDDYTYVAISYLRDMTAEEIRMEDEFKAKERARTEKIELEQLEALKAKYEGKGK